jgi:hypothetical protein
MSIILLGAEIAADRGDTMEARARYATVFAAVTDYGSLGWGTAGWTPHAYFVYQRRALALDVAPQLTRLDLTPEFAQRLLPLVALHQQADDSLEASQVFEYLKRADPTLRENAAP